MIWNRESGDVAFLYQDNMAYPLACNPPTKLFEYTNHFSPTKFWQRRHLCGHLNLFGFKSQGKALF
jgi:hypothetical protein